MGKPAANDVRTRKIEAVAAEEEAAEEEQEGDEVKVENWAGAAATDGEDEYGGGDEDESEEEEGKRCEMLLFPAPQVTSALFPPLRSARGRGDSCGWRHSR